MTEKRAHAELAIKFYSDSKMKCWYWNEKSQTWLLAANPGWFDGKIYEVSETKPTRTPKRKVTMAGITFDAPETEAPARKTGYWLAQCGDVFHQRWNDAPLDKQWLGRGLIHLDEENARLHAEALRKLNRQLCGMEDAA